MHEDIDAELARLQSMTLGELLETYREVFGQPSFVRHQQHLVRKIAWRLQAGPGAKRSDRALRRVAELVDPSDLRVISATGIPGRPRPPRRKPIPGTVICRPYKDQVVEVLVLDDGFEFDGQRYSSLSAIAKHATGSHWNGNLFFGIPTTPRRNEGT